MDSSSKLDERAIARQIAQMCSESPTGISDKELSAALNISNDEKVDILNKLIDSRFIKPVQKPTGIYYFYQNPEEASKLDNLDRDSKVIYELIASSGSLGLSKTELNKKSNFNPINVGNAIKNLEKRDLIKHIKSLEQKNKNVYILMDVTPDEKVTGNLLWYENGQFNKPFFDLFYKKVFGYIEADENHKGVSFNSIAHYLRSSELNNGQIRDSHVRDVVNVLKYNGKIDEFPGTTKENPEFRVSDWEKIGNLSSYTLTPCGTCPVFDECKEGSVISPENCIYFLDW